MTDCEQKPCSLTSPCHVNHPLTLNVQSLHLKRSETLVICCSVFSKVNEHLCGNTGFTEDKLYGDIDKFLNWLMSLVRDFLFYG